MYLSKPEHFQILTGGINLALGTSNRCEIDCLVKDIKGNSDYVKVITDAPISVKIGYRKNVKHQRTNLLYLSFTLKFIHSFIKRTLRAYYLSGTVLALGVLHVGSPAPHPPNPALQRLLSSGKSLPNFKES